MASATMLRSSASAASKTLLRRRLPWKSSSSPILSISGASSNADEEGSVNGRHRAHQRQSRRSYRAFAWGTSKKGTIPLPEILAEAGDGGGDGDTSSSTSSGGTAESVPSSSGGTSAASAASSMMDRGTTFDHPREIDSSAAFGLSAGVESLRATLTDLVCGPTSSAAILSDGTLLTWGDNSYGQLGHGHKTSPIPRPRKVPPPPDSALFAETGAASVSLGPTHSAIVDTNGDLYTMGLGGSALNGMGMLCHGDETSVETPRLVRSLVEDGVYAAKVACGELHTTVLTTEGETLTAGGGSYGRLGNLDTSNDQLFLEPVEMLEGEEVVDIAAGHAFTLALTNEGVVYSWGRNDKGQLGLGAGLSVDIYAMEAMPSPIESQLEGRRVKKIAAGHSHAAAVTMDGELFVWGSGTYLEPQPYPSLLHSKIVDVACGQDYTVALSDDGRLYSFGKGKTGVLGLASVKKANQPTLVEGLASSCRVVKMSAGYAHFACLAEDAKEEEKESDGGGDEKKGAKQE